MQDHGQQEGAPLAPPVPPRLERLPEPPSLGCDDEEQDKKVTAKMYSIYWLKVKMWIALVDGRIDLERWPALIANKLKGDLQMRYGWEQEKR